MARGPDFRVEKYLESPPQSECDETRTLRSSAAMAQFTGQTLRDNSYDRKVFIFVHSLPFKCKKKKRKFLVTAVVQRSLPPEVAQVYAGVQSSALLLRFNSKTL